jgi:hypothetical protein
MFNILEYFQDSAVEACSIPISTGRNLLDLTAIRKGAVIVAQSSGQLLLLPESLYVPNLTKNLISMTRLMTKSSNLLRRGTQVRVLIDNMIEFDCQQSNGVLEIEGCIGLVPSQPSLFATTTHFSTTTPFQTWHQCLGHAGISRLQAVLPGVKLLNKGTCDSCMRGKVSRIPF